ncbi:MAG: GNAT family N-acetyltransferase [Candidatus Krumholzibacteriia bacterium]
MEIRTVRPDERAEFLALVDAEIRPAGATTRARDDFPVVLGEENAAGQLVAVVAGELAGCLSFLVRSLATTWGELPVAGVGSVVTRADHRGRGVSRALQTEAMALLRRQDVPLAVLWADHPEIYAGRGFRPAGVEFHVRLQRARLADPLPPGVRCEPYQPRHLAGVASVFAGHPLRTLRRSADAAVLYGMPGTTGLVAEDGAGVVQAYVFCGKGADFRGYVLEWGGRRAPVLGLLAEVQRRALAHHVLVPRGAEDLVDLLVDRGAGWYAVPSGCWCVLDPDQLRRRGVDHRWQPPPGADLHDARTWLGGVGDDGAFELGRLGTAVWGFDSV